MNRGWKYAAASVIGTSHLGTPNAVCQDAHVCAYDGNTDRLVCVVSDGAGSASCSERGSRTTCDLISESVLKADSEAVHTKHFALETLGSVRTAIFTAATQDGLRIRDFACTLLVAIVSGLQATFWQIGDGAICFRLASEDAYKFAFWPVKGEYANTTCFITDEDAVSEFEFDSVQCSISDLAIFSDGLERLALDFKAGEVHTKFFSGLFAHLYPEPVGYNIGIERGLKHFLDSERINSKTDDDKTLVLATTENR